MKIYSATATFLHARKGTNFISQYEERTVIVKANSLEEASDAIQNDFEAYCSDETTLLRNYEIQELPQGINEKVIEVASFIRVTDVKEKKYFKTFKSDLRPKSCKDKNWKHKWYKRNKNTLACYNCHKIKNL